MAVADVYELVDVQNLYGQEVLNVYFYEQTAAFTPTTLNPTVANLLANQFNLQIMESIQRIQSGDLNHTAIRVRNLFDLSDTSEILISEPGLFAAAAGNTAPGFVAVGFKEVHGNGAIRPGGKRYGAVPNGIETDGVITDSSFLTNLADTAAALVQVITDGGATPIDTFIPVIVKRILTIVDGEREYSLPTTLGEKVVGQVVEAIFDILTTSQVSRKVGVGA